MFASKNSVDARSRSRFAFHFWSYSGRRTLVTTSVKSAEDTNLTQQKKEQTSTKMAQGNPPSVVERARSIAATLDTPTKGGQLRAKKGPLERSSSENMKGDPDALRRISASGLRNDVRHNMQKALNLPLQKLQANAKLTKRTLHTQNTTAGSHRLREGRLSLHTARTFHLQRAETHLQPPVRVAAHPRRGTSSHTETKGDLAKTCRHNTRRTALANKTSAPRVRRCTLATPQIRRTRDKVRTSRVR